MTASELPEKINVIAQALTEVIGTEADTAVITTIIATKCTAEQAEAALFIVALNELGYDVTKLERDDTT